MRIMTWSIGVILASKVIDSVDAVLKDLVNSSPTVLWNDLNCLTIDLRLRAETQIAQPYVKMGSTAEKYKKRNLLWSEPHEFLIQLFTTKRALFADAHLALIWLVHFNWGSKTSPRRVADSEGWIWLPFTVSVSLGNLVRRLEKITKTVFCAFRLSLISRNLFQVHIFQTCNTMKLGKCNILGKNYYFS